MTRRALGLPVLATLAALAGTPAALAAPDAGRFCGGVPALKADYLSCERGAMLAEMPQGEIARCSLVYERLKATAFDGSFRALHDWYMTVRVAEAPRVPGRSICG